MTARTTPPPDQPLMARTAEMLALPQTVCRRRACRRNGRCSWFHAKSQAPCCLANLDAEQRRLFDQLLKLVRDARDFGSYAGKIVFASPWRGERELQDAAVEAARPLVAKRARRAFRAFERMRDRQAPPKYDGVRPPPEPVTAGVSTPPPRP